MTDLSPLAPRTHRRALWIALVLLAGAWVVSLLLFTPRTLAPLTLGLYLLLPSAVSILVLILWHQAWFGHPRTIGPLIGGPGTRILLAHSGLHGHYDRSHLRALRLWVLIGGCLTCVTVGPRAASGGTLNEPLSCL
jgi:hypothetical protein